MEYTINLLEEWNEKIEALAILKGLNCYAQEFELIDYKDMIANEAYLGMPSRYPHWSFGKAFERNNTTYKYNLSGLPYEMVINSNPCIAYLMKENTLLLQILTMAHVYGHNDFFKNNRLFVQGTNAKYTVEMFKFHADMVRGFINDPSIGYEKVERILDAAHALKLQTSRVISRKRVAMEDVKPEPEEDILYYIIQHGDIKEWEKRLLEMVRKETSYFLPQIETKIMNEGWASYWHYNLLKELNLEQGLYLEFIKRHNDVIAPHLGGLNPYYIGFKIFEDLEKKFGREKIFEVRKVERDVSFLRKYLTLELCDELNLFQYFATNGEYKVKEVADEQGFFEIRANLCDTCGLGSVPIIQAIEINKNDRQLVLEHLFDGRELNQSYAEYTLKYANELWGHSVLLKTKQNDKEIKIVCSDKKISIVR